MPDDQAPAESSTLDREKTPDAGPRGWTPPPPEEIARLLPNYDVLSLLGRGGMGAVYLAVQRALDREVAIKLLPLEVSADRDFADRFVREARVLAKLHHPHIVEVHDFGKTAEGHLYIVMEYVDGANLHERIHGAGLAPAQALHIAAQVCEALAYAHAQGVVHRDIKPANVMVDQGGRAKVADFGLARLSDPTAEHLGTTMTGTVMGTADYMAPEQRRGMQVDHRADIYSLGVMLYEMLCGEVPRGVFEPPSRRAECDPRADQVVTRAMQQEPALRYQSTQEMKTDVDAARTPLEKAESKTPRTRTAAIVAIVAVCLVLVSAGAFFLWEKMNASRAARAAESSPALQRAKPSQATGRPDGLKPGTTLPTATADAPFVNTLGMKFVPVPILGGPTGGQRVLFSVWDTRVQDYATFATETRRDWNKPDFEQGPTHPAVMVSWDDAQVFSQWLTAREQAAGRLGVNERYRLPSDHEWSCAVGIGAREDAAQLPSEKDGKITDAFPSGTQWPPLKGAGNYAGEELQPDREAGKFKSAKAQAADKAAPGDFVASGYNDGFVNTSPVGSFAANHFGLYDLGGNVRQWCEDWFDQDQTERVLRGASWNGRRRSVLLSSARNRNAPTNRGHFDGFRCVLESAPAGQASASPRFPPGKWTRVPPEALRENDLVTDAEGWSRLPASRARTEVPGAKGRNWGLRATFRNQPADEHMPELALRRRNGSLSAQLYREGTIFVVYQSNDAAPARISKYQELARVRLTESVPAGTPFTIEFIAVGTHLIARCHGTTVRCEAPPDGPASGDVAIRGPSYDAFRDVEVLNLDGLSEAEAMKAAGMSGAGSR